MAVPPARRPKGEGSVSFHKASGRWLARLRVGTKPHPTVAGRLVPDIRTAYRATREEAEAALLLLRADALRGTLAPPPRRTGAGGAEAPTVGALLDRLLAEKAAAQWTPEAIRRHRDNADLRLRPAFGAVRADRLAAADVARLLADLAARPRTSPRTIAYAHDTLAQALDLAVRDGQLARNVARLVRPPAQRPRRAPAVLTPAETARIEAAAPGLRLGALWIVALYTGARLGELLALRWRDCDLAAGRVTIRRTWATDAARRAHVAERTKRRASARTIPLPKPAAAALDYHRAHQPTTSATLVFCRPDGALLHESTATNYDFKRLLVPAADLPADAHPHTLRHTFATRAIEKGRSLNEVAYVLGHASVQVTATIYAHVLSRVDEAGAKTYDALYE